MITFERRKMERFLLELPTSLLVTSQSEKPESIELVTSNVCAGGAFFKTDKPLTVGTDVKSAIILPLDKFENVKNKISHIDISGSVTRTDQQGMAICFDKKYKIFPY